MITSPPGQRARIQPNPAYSGIYPRRTATDIIAAGSKLAETRDLLRHDKAGGFDGWRASQKDWLAIRHIG